MTDYSITLPSYSIGEQVYKQIPTVCAPFGATAVVIGGHKAMAAVRERLLAAIHGSAVTITDFVWYGGEASRENIAALAENPAVAAADMIFAVGGGKALDTGKAYGEESGKPVFTFPTIASTCAATTAVSVHAFILPSVIAAAPRRYIWAGMGDTYAKYFEAEMSSRGEALVHYHALGVNVSRMCLDPLLTYGAQAMADIDAERCTYAVEQVILAIIVTTGIASILLTAEHIVDYNSGLAHAVFYALTAWPHIETRHLHGEVVGFGVLILLLTDGNLDSFRQMYAFNRSVGLPTALSQVEMTGADVEKLVPLVAKMPDIAHNPYTITEEMLHKAFADLDYYNQHQAFKENE